MILVQCNKDNADYGDDGHEDDDESHLFANTVPRNACSSSLLETTIMRKHHSRICTISGWRWSKTIVSLCRSYSRSSLSTN